MDYSALATRLYDDGSNRTMTAFPDGSIDKQYRVTDASGNQFGSRAAFGERIAAGDIETFSIERESVTIGGQAVNMACQAAELGNTVSLYGHLDDSRFESLDFETVSMGEPATVYVYDFDGSDLLLADNPDAMSEWSLTTLRTAMGGPYEFEERMTADAVCCANWISFDGLTTALSTLGEQSLCGNYFVLDPGDLTTESDESITDLCTAVCELEQSYDVVLSMNTDETDRMAASLSIDATDSRTALQRLRSEIGVTGVVLHGSSEAIGATPNGVITVPTIRVEDVTQVTGAGDRFGAGMAHGLARNWKWARTIQLGNLCASYHVEHGHTGSRAALAACAEQAGPPE